MANDKNLQVTLTGDNSQLDKSLQDAINSISDFGNNVSSGLMKAALGFGSMAGLADKAVGLIIDGLKSIVEYIPNCIDKTNELTETFKGLGITAGLSVSAFNTLNAAVQLSGGKAEDLTSIVGGMEKGIKKNSEVLVANGIAVDKTALSHMTMGQYIEAVVNKMDSLTSATEKDQLLMQAFGKGGMQFASMLVEINKNQKDAQDITAAGGSITDKAIKDLEAHNAAQGRLNLAIEKQKALVAAASGSIEDRYHDIKAAAIEYSNDCTVALDAASKGHIKLKSIIDESIGSADYDYKQMIADLKQFNKEIEEAVKSSKDFMDVGTNPSKNKTTLITPEQIQKEKDDARKKQEEADRLAILAASALKELQMETTHLKMEELKSVEAITLEEKRQKAENVAGQTLDDTRTKIGTTESKSKDPKVHKAANEARIEAEKVYVSQMMAIDDKFNIDTVLAQTKIDTEVLNGKKQHETGLLAIELEKINVLKNLDLISGEEEVRRTIEINNRIYNEELTNLNKKVMLFEKEQLERQKVLNEIQTLTDKHNKEQIKDNQKLDEELAKKNPMAGMVKGYHDYINAAKEYGTQFRNAVTTTMNAAETSISNAMKGMITGQETLAQGIKSVWVGITDAILGCITQMVAKWIVASVAAAVFGTAVQAASNTQAAAALDTSVAESYAAYAYIPFGGLALAQAQIGMIMAGFTAGKAADKTLTTYATGGYADKPTYGVFGEKGPELLAPKEDFLTVTKALVASGASMYRSIVASQAATNRYSASPTIPSNSVTNNSRSNATHIHLEGSTILGQSLDSANIIGKKIASLMNDYSRRNG